MNFIVENWAIIFGMAVMLAFIIATIVIFANSGKETQIQNLKEWLLYATTLAEKELGSGTGKLKLRYVYDMFVVKFPWLAKIVSFDKFSSMVDDALIDMRELIYNNDNVRAYTEEEC